MRLSDFVALIKTVAPKIKKNRGPGNINYTTWSTGSPAYKLMSDDQAEDAVQRVYVDHFTQNAEDSIPQLIEEALDKAFIPFELVKDYEEKTLYHHYSFTCYVG